MSTLRLERCRWITLSANCTDACQYCLIERYIGYRQFVYRAYVTVNLRNWLREIPSNFALITDIYWQLLHEITNPNPNPNPFSTPTLNLTLYEITD